MVSDAAVTRPMRIFVVVGLLLAVIVPLVVVSGASERIASAWVIQIVIVVHAGIMLARVLTSTRLEVMQLAFWVFVYVWLAVAPLAMLTTDEYPWGLRVGSEVSFTASVVIETGLLAYTAGSLFAERTHRDGGGLPTRLLGRELSLPRVLVLGVMALLLAGVLVPRLGGIDSFFTSREAASEAAREITGSTGNAGAALLEWGLTVPAFWALMGFIHVRRTREPRELRVAWLWLLVPVILLNVVVNNPISQPRFWAGTVLLTLVFTSPPMRSVKLFRIGGAALLVALVVLFPAADYFRTEGRETTDGGVGEQFTGNPDYDAYQQVQAGVLLVDEVGHQPKLALGVPFFWVPRSVWPDKPEDAGVVIGKFVGYSFLNLSSPLWVESYIWAGLPLTAVVFAGLGGISGWLDRVNHRYRHERSRVVGLVVPALAFYQLILLRGSLLQAMAAFTLLAIIPFLVTRSGRASPGRGDHRERAGPAKVTIGFKEQP